MSTRIAIVDYGLSNLACVKAAVEHLGFDALVGGNPEDIEKADKVILPGVGAFGDAMRNLRERDLDKSLNEYVLKGGKPFLGICLGAQLIVNDSDEFGEHVGLGWVNAHVRKLDSARFNLRVPHTGWDNIEQIRHCVLGENIPRDALFYFTHSHGIFCNDEEFVVGVCHYGQSIAVMLQKDNIFATQFHPEKSQRHGLRLMENFLSRA